MYQPVALFSTLGLLGKCVSQLSEQCGLLESLTVVSYQNVSSLFALSLLHNLREDGGKQDSSHFDEKLSF